MANLDTLVSSINPTPPGKVRGVSREMDPLKVTSSLPWLMVYDGDEYEVGDGASDRGRTYRFPLMIKILLADPRNLAEAKDLLVPEVQRVMESDLQLNGLADTVEGGTETPYLSEVHKPEGGALVGYEIQYRRKYGDPYTTY